MADLAIEFDQVWKKFRRGETHDCLRDFIPAIAKRLFLGEREQELYRLEFWALRDVSFQVQRGEALGIIGPNGSGKTTILKLLSRILTPNKGKAKANGRLSALIQVGAGFHPDLTGRENIYLNGTILGMKKAEITNKFNDIVEFSELRDFIDTPVKRYSSGMYARLGFSVSAHIDPDILLVDEVLSVGDMKFQQKCLDRMRTIANSGTTIIFISHNLESVQNLCPRSLYLNSGRIMRIGNTADVIAHYLRSRGQSDGSEVDSVGIGQVMLCDDRAMPTHTFRPSQRAQLRFTIKSFQGWEQCLLGFTINRATDRLPVCDYNLPLETVVNHLPPGLDEIPLAVGFRTNLLRGTYVVSLHIYHGAESRFVYRADDVATFSLEERISSTGVSHLSPELQTLEGF